MGLAYILSQTGFKAGLNPADATQRSVLLRFINEAAVELYQTSDMAGCLEEQYFKINANQTIACPEYVGQIRAMREAYSHTAIKLSQMRPRYNQFNWEDGWRNWRVKNLQTLQTSVHNMSVLNLHVDAVESTPVVVTISGPTNSSSNASETIVMDATDKQTVNSYIDIGAFTKSTINQYNIILSDIDGNQISYLANDQLKAKFQIVDISGSPWVPFNVNPLLGWVEVLYKKALPVYEFDYQEFPAVGYDNVWVAKVLQLWFEEQNNVQAAMAYNTKAVGLLAAIHEDGNRGTDDMVAMVENSNDLLFPRTGFGRDWRYAYRIIGR